MVEYILSIGWSALVFVFVLGVLVFIHELGHFLVAKWCGVGVVKFAIGFGPAIFKFRRGDTYYQIGCIPLGGYVRMIGDVPDIITGVHGTDKLVRSGKTEEIKPQEVATPELHPEENTPEYRRMLADRSQWFIEQPLLQRAAIVFAGPLFNFVLAVLLVATNISFFGESQLDETPRIGGVSKGSPAERAGLREGDLVETLDGTEIGLWSDLAKRIGSGTGAPIKLNVRRGAELVEFTVQPELKSIPFEGEIQKRYQIGMRSSEKRIPVGVGRALQVGYLWSQNFVIMTYKQLWGMFSGKVSPKELAGPLYIFNAGPAEAAKGIENFVMFMALLSVSLAALNLLPIPVLDGGHLLFFLVEAVVGPISVRKKEFAQQLGVVVLVLLMVCALGNDIGRVLGSKGGEEESKKSSTNSGQPAAVETSDSLNSQDLSR